MEIDYTGLRLRKPLSNVIRHSFGTIFFSGAYVYTPRIAFKSMPNVYTLV